MITNGMQRLIGFVVTATLVLAACGGGSGNNVAGIDRTGAPVIAAYGTVSAFGSVVVNGVHYNTSGAAFTIDGDAGSQSDLGIGDVVLVKGTLDSGGATGIATSVRFDNNVEGPISSIDTAAGTFVVLSQLIRVDADTSFDSTIQPPLLASLTVGDVVEVSGLVQGDTSVRATRIERQPAGRQFEVTGTVAVNQANQRLFFLNQQIVDYQNAQLRGLPGNVVGNGQRVLVKGTLLNTVLLATRVDYLGGVFDGTTGDRREVEGLITRFTSATDFAVSGLPVTTTSQTTYEAGSASSLALNVKLQVEGSLNDAGVLVATKVEIRQSASARIVTGVDSVSTAAGSFVALGITIKVDALTRLEDQSTQQVRPFALANLAAGDYVEVRGTESPVGSGQLLATLVERRNLQPDAQVEGFVQTVSPPTFAVLGVQVTTDVRTQFGGVNGVAQIAVGDLVRVTGQKLGDRAMTATAVEVDD
jgi:hypothetical protein